jgi:antirestriction protein ArdC
MATLPSGDIRPEGFSPVRRDAGDLVSALERGIIPWLRQDWLESAGALPPNFAPSGRCDVEEGFHELFAATGMDSCHGASITFYSQFDDMIHLTSGTEARNATFLSDWVHELLHATGHVSRLARELPPAFGHNNHGMEDLIAEIAGSIVCADLGIMPKLRHPESVGLWIDLLRTDLRALADAVRHARAAAEYLFDQRDAQAAAADQWEIEEARIEQEALPREAAARRLARRAESKRWGLRFATVKRSGESFPPRAVVKGIS